MAPHSDVDIAFITPYKPTGWTEQVIESMLYSLWDLRLKVGHSSRSIDETMRMAREDLTIRTALLEGRYIWGDQTVYGRSEEHTSELQSLMRISYAVFCLKKKKKQSTNRHLQINDIHTTVL